MVSVYRLETVSDPVRGLTGCTQGSRYCIDYGSGHITDPDGFHKILLEQFAGVIPYPKEVFVPPED